MTNGPSTTSCSCCSVYASRSVKHGEKRDENGGDGEDNEKDYCVVE